MLTHFFVSSLFFALTLAATSPFTVPLVPFQNKPHASLQNHRAGPPINRLAGSAITKGIYNVQNTYYAALIRFGAKRQPSYLSVDTGSSYTFTNCSGDIVLDSQIKNSTTEFDIHYGLGAVSGDNGTFFILSMYTFWVSWCCTEYEAHGTVAFTKDLVVENLNFGLATNCSVSSS